MEWTIDKAETVVEFSIKQFWGLVTVKGQMQVIEGRLELEKSSDYRQGSVDIKIDPASVATGNSRRDAHLKTADFFEVERYPVITFRGRSVEQSEAAGFN
jgi:polyisoprenoid-binding protein YceI